jgi:protocatechuate 4,5-dioxygenase beta chain
MAQLIGGLGTSHIPAIGGAIHKGLQQEPYWTYFPRVSRRICA